MLLTPPMSAIYSVWHSGHCRWSLFLKGWTQPRMPGCLHYSYHRSIHHPLILALLAQDSKYMVAKPGSQGCQGVIRGALLRLLREELTSHQDLCNGVGSGGGVQFPKSSTWVQMLSSQTVTDAHYFKCFEYSQLGVFLAWPYSSRISQMCPLYY